MKILFQIIILIAVAETVHSQPLLEWQNFYGSPSSEFVSLAGIAADPDGNVFVTGTVTSATLTDMLTLKYSPGGALLWARAIAYPIEDRAVDMSLDSKGNVLVTGLTENNTGTYDILTVKYNTHGDSVWVRRYDSQGTFIMDQPVAMFVDRNDNVIVAGYSFGGGPSFSHVIIKYEPDGDSAWVRKIQPGGTPLPVDVTADLNGNVYVSGRGLLLTKYSTSGTLQWSRSYSGFNSAETNRSLLTDESGNVYSTATAFTSTFDDYALLKFNSNGDTLWTRIRNGLGSGTQIHDDVYSLRRDVFGNLIIGGQSQSLAVFHFATIKYSSSGSFIWERNLSSPQSGAGVNDVYTDALGNIYSAGGSGDIRAVKYNSAGDSLFNVVFNGPSNLNDYRPLITGDIAGNVLVCGLSREAGSPQYFRSVVMKYSQSVINLKVIPQGFYNGITGKLNSADSVRVYLRTNIPPYEKVDSAIAIIDSVTFSAACRFSRAVSGGYYISVIHRNSVETWSSAPGFFFVAGVPINYDFTASAGQAFGNNQVQVSSAPVVYAVYSGDVNRDGIVDAVDASSADNDAFNFVTGYAQTDVTGDLFVDANDASVIDNNAFLFVGTVLP
ncbi:MAG: hypothetical protein K1X85_00130 [Ignavibacteria bacterium]|nr:hypothetical protein [Ignavibacteria bacterium]